MWASSSPHGPGGAALAAPPVVVAVAPRRIPDQEHAAVYHISRQIYRELADDLRRADREHVLRACGPRSSARQRRHYVARPVPNAVRGDPLALPVTGPSAASTR